MPTTVFACGAECGQAGSVGQHWSALSVGVTFDPTIKRTGTRSLKLDSTLADRQIDVNGLATVNKRVVRFYVYFETLTLVTYSGVLAVLDTDTGVVYNGADGKIYARAGGTNGTNGVSIVTGQFYRIDVKVDISANPWLVNVSVDGVACGEASVAASPVTKSLVRLRTDLGTGQIYYFDDIVVSDTLDDYPLGAGTGWCGVPTADGAHNVAGAADFRRGDTTTDITNATTTAYQLVDEVPLDDVTPDTDDHIRIVTPPNVTDYVELVFGPAPGFSALTVAPNGVEVIAEVFAAGTGLSDEIIKLNDNGTLNNVYDGTGLAGLTTGTYKGKHYATAPSTGVAWTAALVNGLRLRYGYANDANPDKSLMCVMLEVDVPTVATRRRNHVIEDDG